MGRADRNRAIVIGKNYISILTMVRDLGEAGYDIDVIRVFTRKPGIANIMSRMEPEKASRYVRNYHEVVTDGNDEILKELLIKIGDEENKALLVPVDDLPVQVMDTFREELSPYYTLPVIEGASGEITRLMDKGIQKQMADQAGLYTAKGMILKAGDPLPEIPEDLFPLYVKPSVSSGSSKLSMGKCSDMDELQKLLASSNDEDQLFLAEQFIDAAHEHSVVGVCLDGDIQAWGAFRSVMPGHDERQGVAVMGVTEDLEEMDNVSSGIRKLMKLTGYTGMFDIDLLEDKSGKYYFAEINFRAGASCHAFSYEGGLNIPALCADACQHDRAIERSSLDKTGKLFLSEKALLEEYVRGNISRKEFKDCLNDADVYFIKDERDTGPYKIFRRYLRMSPVLKSVYHLK